MGILERPTKSSAIRDLQRIMQEDYSIAISDDQAKELGASLLRLSVLAVTALARADEKNSSIQAREEISLEPKTNT